MADGRRSEGGGWRGGAGRRRGKKVKGGWGMGRDGGGGDWEGFAASGEKWREGCWLETAEYGFTAFGSQAREPSGRLACSGLRRTVQRKRHQSGW